jgi:hypothetical protein
MYWSQSPESGACPIETFLLGGKPTEQPHSRSRSNSPHVFPLLGHGVVEEEPTEHVFVRGQLGRYPRPGLASYVGLTVCSYGGCDRRDEAEKPEIPHLGYCAVSTAND